MKYTIYKITNKLNDKIYIGKHQTKDLNDGYMGSGKLLRRAQEKYGIENFVKEILHVFDTEVEMNAKEAELVSDEFCLREDTYNICTGGQGGFSYINNNPDKFLTEKRLASLWTNKERTERRKQKYKTDEEFRKRHYEITIAAGKKARENNPLGTFYGKKHSDEAKKIIGAKNSIAMSGSGNSQHGTMWITNGVESLKIKSVDLIPEGWYKGRVIKNRRVGQPDNR
jgi:GIY-YIG catalytic domain